MLNIVKESSPEVPKSEKFERIFTETEVILPAFGHPDLSGLKIRKVKAVSPSPFYDGKYHPPKLSS